MKPTTEVVIIAPYTGKCEVIQKPIIIPQSYHESMKKYAADYNPNTKKKESTRWQHWDKDPFRVGGELRKE